MKILIDARLYGPENTGIGRYVTNLVKELKKQDIDNEYVILLRKKYYDSLAFPGNWQKALADFTHYSFSEQFKLVSIISRYKPDLTHFLHFNLPVLFRGKYIVTIHDLLMGKRVGVSATTLPFYLYYPKHFAARTVLRRGIKNAYKIIVPSEVVKDEVVATFKVDPGQVVVTYEGVDAQIDTSSNSSILLKKYNLTNPYFLYVGNPYPHKNLERAVRAIIDLNSQSKNKYLLAIVCARSIFTQRLEKLINKTGAQKYVKLLGFVPDEDLGALYKNSLAFLYPSFSEGFGLPGLEAMSSGSLVLSSNIPVFKEVYKDNAIYFDPYNTDSIKESMQKVISMDSKERNNLIKKSQEFIKKYTWAKMAKETLKVYRNSV